VQAGSTFPEAPRSSPRLPARQPGGASRVNHRTKRVAMVDMLAPLLLVPAIFVLL
jgi:hypothetical protein